MENRFEHFKKYFENKRQKWKVFYKEELPDKVTEPKTVYFVITGDSIINKQKTIDLSIYYVISRKKDGLLDFRKEINDFIYKELETEFATPYFYQTSGYEIEYSISDDRKTLRIAEIKCTFDYTLLDKEKDKHVLMNILEDKIIVKE